MLRLGGTASQSHMDAFEGLVTIFRRRGIELDWPGFSNTVNISPNGDLKQILQEKVPIAGAFVLGYLIGLVRS